MPLIPDRTINFYFVWLAEEHDYIVLRHASGEPSAPKAEITPFICLHNFRSRPTKSRFERGHSSFQLGDSFFERLRGIIAILREQESPGRDGNEQNYCWTCVHGIFCRDFKAEPRQELARLVRQHEAYQIPSLVLAPC